MKTYSSTTTFAAISLFLLISMMPLTVFAQQDNGNGLIGRDFKIFIYGNNVDKASATFSFKESLNLLIDVYDGFGIYVPIGNVFAGFFSAPNYSKTQDLLIILSGVVVSGFLGGVGLVYIDYAYNGVWLFFGYAQE